MILLRCIKAERVIQHDGLTQCRTCLCLPEIASLQLDRCCGRTHVAKVLHLRRELQHGELHRCLLLWHRQWSLHLRLLLLLLRRHKPPRRNGRRSAEGYILDRLRLLDRGSSSRRRRVHLGVVILHWHGLRGRRLHHASLPIAVERHPLHGLLRSLHILSTSLCLHVRQVVHSKRLRRRLRSLYGRHIGKLWLLRCVVRRHLRCSEGILKVGRESSCLGRLQSIVAETCIGRRSSRTWEVPIARAKSIVSILVFSSDNDKIRMSYPAYV